MNELLKVSTLSPELILDLVASAERMEQSETGIRNCLKGKTAAMLFFEASTRTHMSFQAAALRLGADIISSSNPSLAKGETVVDTLRVVSGYADVLVLRYPGEDILEIAQTLPNTRIVNAGSGGSDHPTQALTDALTIYKEFGRLGNLSIAVGVDPKHSRSIKSLCELLSHFSNNVVHFVAPKEFHLEKRDLEKLSAAGLNFHLSTEMNSVTDCEIIYLNRFQVERHAEPLEAIDLERLRNLYRIDATFVKPDKTKLILNPLPRVAEIDTSVDQLPEAAYFRQAQNGVAMRMAILDYALGR